MKNPLLLILTSLIVTFVSCKKDPEEPAPVIVGANIVFQKTLGPGSGDGGGTSIVQTADGGYFITGEFLTKTDAAGNIIFTKPISANSIRPTFDGCYVLAGKYAGEFYKIDANGNIIWTGAVTGSTLNYITPTFHDGKYVAVGTNGKVFGIDSNGGVLWTRLLGTFGVNDNLNFKEICQSPYDDGFFIVGTQVTGSTWDSQFVVYKLTVAGYTTWYKEFGSVNYSNEGWSVKATTDGGCVAAGMTGSGLFDMEMIRLDTGGHTKWIRDFGSANAAEGAANLQITADGGFIVIGSTDVDGTGNTADVYIVKTNASGQKTWEQTFGGSQYDYGRWIQQTSDGGYIATGMGNYTSSGGVGELYLLKISE